MVRPAAFIYIDDLAQLIGRGWGRLRWRPVVKAAAGPATPS